MRGGHCKVVSAVCIFVPLMTGEVEQLFIGLKVIWIFVYRVPVQVLCLFLAKLSCVIFGF